MPGLFAMDQSHAWDGSSSVERHDCFIFPNLLIFATLKEISFTILCWPLPHIHRSAIGIHSPLPLNFPSRPPSPLHPPGCYRGCGYIPGSHTANARWLPTLHVTLSMPATSSSSSHPAHVHKLVLYVCVPTVVLETGSSVPSSRFHIYANI